MSRLHDYYLRFRQWQQDGPRYANKQPGTVLHCANCGAEVTDNFCPRCGQRAGVGRVTWRSVRESIGKVLGLDSRSFPYTLLQLLLRPSYLVRDYFNGRRQVSYPPVSMLAVVSHFAFWVKS